MLIWVGPGNGSNLAPKSPCIHLYKPTESPSLILVSCFRFEGMVLVYCGQGSAFTSSFRTSTPEIKTTKLKLFAFGSAPARSVRTNPKQKENQHFTTPSTADQRT